MQFQPKGIIFDMDGTLIEFHHNYLISEALRILPKLGAADIGRDLLCRYFKEFNFFGYVPPEKKESFSDSFWSHFNWDDFPPARPLPGALDLLHSLHSKNKQMAIATARLSEPSEILELLKPTRIPDYVLHIASRRSEDVSWDDKRQMLLDCCEAIKIAPKECLMVSDIPPDIECAKDVGFGNTVAVLTGGLLPSVFKGVSPCLILDSVAELHAHIS